MSEETKTFVFGDSGKSSLDPNALLAMMNANGGFGGNGNWLWMLLLFVIFGRNAFGMMGAGGLGNQINNDYGRDLLNQAILGNRTAISELASSLNCSVGQIQNGITSVLSAVQGVGNQVGMSGQAVINAIQQGNSQLAQQLAQCCCDNRLLATQQGYENRIAISEQTGIIGGKIDAQTQMINDRFCQLETRELQNKIDALREERSTLQGQISQANQTAQIQAYLASAVSPLAAGISALKSDVDGIKCKLPTTVSVQKQEGVLVPTCLAAQLGLYGLGAGVTGNGPWL